MTDPLPLPVPVMDRVSEPYWRAAAERRLVLCACTRCGTPMFYPRIACPSCGSDRLEWREATGAGTLYAFSVVHRAPDQAFRARVPYVIGLVDLDEGPRMMTNIVDCPVEAVRIGMRVAVCFEARTDQITLPQFRPAAGG